MQELAQKKDPFGNVYAVKFVAGDEWYFLNDDRFYPYDKDETPAHINEAILDYCARELMCDDDGTMVDNPTREQLVQCAVWNSVLANEEHCIASTEEWPEPTLRKYIYAIEHDI